MPRRFSKCGSEGGTDLLNIQRIILESGGFLKTNQLVIGAMKGWVLEMGRVALRASPSEVRGTSSLISGLASLLSDQGRLGEAEAHCVEALTTRRRTLGDDHPDTLTSINQMADLLKDKGKLGEVSSHRGRRAPVHAKVHRQHGPSSFL